MTFKGLEHWLMVLVIASLLGISYGNFLGLKEGTQECTIHRTHLRGICQSIYDCPFVLKTYRKLRPTFCFLQGRIPYVCCPTRKSSTNDISPPSLSFTCGTSSSEPVSVLHGEALITRALASPSLRDSLPGFEPPAASPSFPSAIDGFSGLLDDPLIQHVFHGIDSFKNSWPWMALLGYGSTSSPRFDCDGVLVNEQWVLTAAHCVIHEFASVVRLGEHNLTTTSESRHEDFGISRTEFHPNYRHPQGYHDLALLKLDRPVNIRSEIRPVCLPWGKKPVPTAGSQLTLTGWGKTTFGGKRSDVLQEATLHIVDHQECINSYSTLLDYSSSYPKGITPDLLCIRDNDGEGQDACQVFDVAEGHVIMKSKAYIYFLVLFLW
ncbi:clotting factor G beta subunit-like isoform X2 [Oratosquilla oratoria]|uniref:clotting factor G beta subunit-like isoform X2 n=1 Tax=Oratosquilla oratoria TaxID=337810 RepID=UPI003F76FDE7